MLKTWQGILSKTISLTYAAFFVYMCCSFSLYMHNVWEQTHSPCVWLSSRWPGTLGTSSYSATAILSSCSFFTLTEGHLNLSHMQARLRWTLLVLGLQAPAVHLPAQNYVIKVISVEGWQTPRWMEIEATDSPQQLRSFFQCKLLYF